jgi:hypothetical protein
MFGELPEMRIARRKFRPRITNTDDRLALEFVIGDALVFHPASVHETVLVGSAEPLGGAQRAFCV